jgi:hypothetical protein
LKLTRLLKQILIQERLFRPTNATINWDLIHFNRISIQQMMFSKCLLCPLFCFPNFQFSFIGRVLLVTPSGLAAVGALNLIAYEGSAAPQSRVLRDQCILQMALTLDAIWNHRNQVALNERRTNLIRVISNLEQRENEYLSFMHQTTEQVLLGNVHWSCPPTGMMKLNVDAVVSKVHHFWLL